MKITISDFSGGLTDSTFTSELNCAEVVENFLIKKDKTLETSPGIEILSTTAPRVPSNKRIQKLVKLANGNFIAFSKGWTYYVTPSSITELQGPAPTFNHANLGDENSIVSISQSLGHIHATSDDRPYQVKIFLDASGVPQLRTAGLPQVASNPTITPTAGTYTWLYTFTHYYEYSVGNTLFIDESAPLDTPIQKTSAERPISISNIPVLANGSDFNWDTSNIKIRIWRTANLGQTFYLVGEVTNGTTVFTDTVTETDITSQETLYTNGGIRPNDMPDPSKYLFEAADTQFSLDVLTNATEEKPFRVKQAITNDPDSAPDDFFTDLRGTLKGGGAVGRSPIVFTEDQTVRLDGLLDETGKGVIQKEPLSNTIGCISHNGVVRGDSVLYFPGQNSFYKTNGFSEPVKLAMEGVDIKGKPKSKVDSLYSAFTTTDTQKERIQGAYDPLNNRVYWTVQEDSSDNDRIYVYHEAHDSFTVLSFVESGISPTALLMDGNDLILGDAQGYLFRMSESFFTHPVVDTSKAVTLWHKAPIKYRWKSTQITGGDGSINKWFTKINAQGNPITNVNMSILSYTNGELESKELYPIRIVPSLTWGDADFTWGDDSFVWNRTSTLNQTRRFPNGRLRARQRQVEFTNAYYTILEATAEAASYVTVNAAAKIATLVTPASYSFGANNEGYDLLIGNNSYRIVSGTADTLTVTDPSGTLQDGVYAWSIKGYGKGQRAHILNFSVEFEPMDDAGTKWHGSSAT